jgi:phosphoglycerate dehydrogenase-like enzyme
MMKAVLPYDPPPSIGRMIAAAGAGLVRIVRVPEGDAEAVRRELGDADVMLHVLAPVTAALMEAAPRLRLVQKIGVGVDAIDRDFARRRGIAVCNMPGTNTIAVAELALGLMLAALRRVASLDAGLRAGRGWPAGPADLDAAGEIAGSCVGLVGYGAVARRLRRVLEALGAEVIVHSRSVPDDGAVNVPLDALLERADIVSLHLPLDSGTRNLFDAGRLARFRPGAVLVNTARGPLVDEAALAAALREGRIAAAGLDVFAVEPPAADNPLFGLRNVVATPHVAWMTPGTWRRSLAVAAENCRRLAAGLPLLHRIE